MRKCIGYVRKGRCRAHGCLLSPLSAAIPTCVSSQAPTMEGGYLGDRRPSLCKAEMNWFSRPIHPLEIIDFFNDFPYLPFTDPLTIST